MHRLQLADKVRRLLVLATFALPMTAADGAQPPDVLKRHAEYVYQITYSRDGNLMATASGDNTAIVWRSSDRTPLHVLKHDSAVYSAVFSTDGKTLATGGGDGTIRLWDVQDGSEVSQLPQQPAAVYCLAFSQTGNALAAVGGDTDGADRFFRVWNPTDRQQPLDFTGHQRQVYGVAFHPDNQRIATTSSDKTIRIWNTSNGESATLNGHSSDVYRCDFSPDGQRLATASQDGSVRVWNLATGTSTTIFQAKATSPVYTVKFSPDGKRLASVGDDRQLRIWNTKDWQAEQAIRISTHALYTAAWSPDQRTIAVAGEEGSVHFVTSAEGTPASREELP